MVSREFPQDPAAIASGRLVGAESTYCPSRRDPSNTGACIVGCLPDSRGRCRLRNQCARYLPVTCLCLACLAFAACSSQPAAPATPETESAAPEDEAVEEGAESSTVESSEPEEAKYTPTYSALGRRLRSDVLNDSMQKLWKQYTPQTGDYIRVNVGTGGNVYAYAEVSIGEVLLAEGLVEDAVSLLIDGKLPGETGRRPVDPEEVAALIAEAHLCFEDSRDATFPRQEGFIEWVGEQEHSDVATEGTVQQIVEEFDFIRECLDKAADAVAGVLEDLPSAVEG